MSYRAYVVDNAGGTFTAGLTTLDESALPPGDVTIGVEWSSVNYKDGLASTPDGKVVRSYPMVPGVDLAGSVLRSDDPRYRVGDPVVVMGNDIGVAHAGGFAELARVPGDWVIPLPAGLTTKEAMALGTAGFTAALSIERLEQFGLRPENGPVIVTGATGGVGSVAVSMLAVRGYTVAASTGKESEGAYLRTLGATEILTRVEVSGASERSLEKERWAGAIDPVGGATTAYLARTMKYGASIALSGNTGGAALATTVFPFILRAVNLLGIEAVHCGRETNLRIWERMASDLKPRRLLESIASEIDLDGLPGTLADILAGRVRGRTLVRIVPA
jgi:putative YhdH/YhfP family quinone oxidoreductase